MSSLELDVNDLGPRINGVGWGLTGAAAVLLGARLYVKRTQHRGFWWDDYLLLASWIMLLVDTALTTHAITLGYGKHFVDVPRGNFLDLLFLVNLTTPFAMFGSAWSKTSFAFTLLRLTKGNIRTVVWAIIFTLNLTLSFNAILPFIVCRPTKKSWNPFIPGECWDHSQVVKYAVFAAAYSAGMDFILALIPWSVIMRLKLKPKEKIGVAICMSLGFFAGVTTIMRTLKTPLLSTSKDFTYENGQLSIWTTAEISTTIMAASIPVLRVLVRHVVQSSRSNPTQNPATGYYSKSAPDGTFKNGTRTTVITSTNNRDRDVERGGGPQKLQKSQSQSSSSSEGGKGKQHKKSFSWLSNSDDDSSDDEGHELSSSPGRQNAIAMETSITVNYERRSMISDGGHAALGVPIQMLDRAPPDEPIPVALTRTRSGRSER